MICDEVQSGIFRTGLPYGFQNFGVLPDIVTMEMCIRDSC